MSTPYHFTPRGPPLVPHSTPLSATAHGFSKPKASRAPIINPYQKFPQDEFDAWIGGITNALRTALGQEEQQRPASSATQDQNPLEEHSGSVNGNLTPQYRTLEQDSESDEVPDDSFADIKARRAKGKARDPREGPGLGGTGGDRAQPITLDFSDDEEDEIAEGLTMVHDQESEEEPEAEKEEEEEDDEEESEGSEEDYQWDRGQSSSQFLSERTVRVGPPRKNRPPDEHYSEEEVAEDDEDVIEEDYEEDYDEEYGEDDDKQDYPSRPPVTTHSSAPEVIDILDSDEEEAAQTQQPHSSPPQEGFDDEYYEEEEEGEGGYDEEYSEDEDSPHPPPQPVPARRSLLADYRARQPREPSYDEEEEEGSYEEDEGEGPYEGDENEAQIHQATPSRLGEDSWLPQENWESDQEQYSDQDNEVYEGGIPDHWQDESDAPVTSSNQALPHQPTGDLHVDHDDEKFPQQYTGFPALPAHFSPPHQDSLTTELPDPWIGPRTYTEDYYASGDVEAVHRKPEAVIDPSLLDVEGIYGGDELLEDTASGIGAFLTPVVLTPNESDILSGADEHESITPDGGAEDQLYSEQPQWDDQWQPTQSYPPKAEESNWNGSIIVPPPLRRGEIPQDAEIIALDDYDEEEENKPVMEKGDEGTEVEEEHDQLQDDDGGMVFDSTVQAAQGGAFEDIYEDNNVVILPPDELSSRPFERTPNPDACEVIDSFGEILPPPSATPPPVTSQFENFDEPKATQLIQAVEPSPNQPLEALNIINDGIYAPLPLFAPTHEPQEADIESVKAEEDDLDDIYGSPMPPLLPAQRSDAEKTELDDHLEEDVEVTHDRAVTLNEAAPEADDNLGSDIPDESGQPRTAKAVAEHLSQLGNLSELPTPPWEKVQSTYHEPSRQSPESNEDISKYKASVEDVSDDEGDADSVPPGPDAIDLDIEMEDGSVEEPVYTVLENEQGDDDDAYGEADDDVEVVSTFSVSEHENDMDEGTGCHYLVEEPVTEGRSTEEPADRSVSIDVESVYPERSVTPVGLREAVQGMGEPSKAELIRLSQGLSKQPSMAEIASEVSDSVELSPKTDQIASVRSDVPMPVTADASVPDPTDSPHSPTRPPRNFILSLTGTPKFILSPANSPRPAGNPIPVSVSLPPSILKALRGGSVEPGMNTTLHPFPLGFVVDKRDGLFTPAGASTSTATPIDLEDDEARQQALNQIADAIYEPVPDENLTEWPGFDFVVGPPSGEQVPHDEGLNVLPTTDVEGAAEEEHVSSIFEASPRLPNGSLDVDTSVEAESAMLLSLALPSITMHLPIDRKPTDPILMADPYPYSLSTPGASESLEGPDEEASDEDATADLSISSTSTSEKEADGMPVNDVDSTMSNSQDHFDYQVSTPSGLYDIGADIFEPFQSDAELEAVTDSQQPPEVGNVETQFADFQEILEAEDPFKLMGSDSTVAPGEVKSANEAPPDDLDSLDGTPEEHQNKHPDASVVIKAATPPLEPVQGPDASGSTQRGAKRKRAGSSGKAEISSSRSKGKRRRSKGKAKEEPSPERPEEDTILVRPRSASKIRQNAKRKSADKGLLIGQGNSATRTLSRNKQGSRASSIASSVLSDKSVAIQPSPTTTKSFDFPAPDSAHVHYQGLLFHAHGNRRKNPYSQPWTVTQQKEDLARPSASRQPSVTQTVEQSPISSSPLASQIDNDNEPAQTPTLAADDNSSAQKLSGHPKANTEIDPMTRDPTLNHSSDDLIENEGTSTTSQIRTSANSPQVSSPLSPAHSIAFPHPSSAARSTRSQCKFHKMSLPREEGGPRVHFIVPGCTLSNLQLLKEEEIEDHGQATSEEGDRMVGHIETLHFNLQLIGIIRQLVGVDIIRENAVYYLPRTGETVRRQSPQKPQGAKAHGLHLSPAISGSTHSSIRPPISNADSTSTSLSARRRMIEPSEELSTVSSTESEPEGSEDDYEPTSKRAKPSPPEPLVAPDGQDAAASQLKRGKGRPRKIKPQNMAYKPDIDQPDDESPVEGSSKKPKPTRRGVKRSRTTDVMVEEGGERKAKKLRSHTTAPGSFSSLKASGK